MLSEREILAAQDYWTELQYEASQPENLGLRAALMRVGNDPPMCVILELYAEYVYGVRRLKGCGPLVFTGARKPGNEGRRR